MVDQITNVGLKKKVEMLSLLMFTKESFKKLKSTIEASSDVTACAMVYEASNISDSLGVCNAQIVTRRHQRRLHALNDSYVTELLFLNTDLTDDALITAKSALANTAGVSDISVNTEVEAAAELRSTPGVSAETVTALQAEINEAAEFESSSVNVRYKVTLPVSSLEQQNRVRLVMLRNSNTRTVA
jgi:hypothetical protein